SMGRSKDRGRDQCGALSEEIRRYAGAVDLQIRFSGHTIYLPVERQVRLSLTVAVGRGPAQIRRADGAIATMAGRRQSQGNQKSVHHLPLSGVLPRRPRTDS